MELYFLYLAFKTKFFLKTFCDAPDLGCPTFFHNGPNCNFKYSVSHKVHDIKFPVFGIRYRDQMMG